MHSTNLIRMLLIIGLIVISKILLYVTKRFNEKIHTNLVRNNGKRVPLKLIKRALRIKLGAKIKRITKKGQGPYINITTKEIFMPKFNNRDLGWYSSLSHEIGHAILHCKKSIQNYIGNTAIFLFVANIVGITALFKMRPIIWYPFLGLFFISAILILIKEMQASIFGYRLMCKTFKLNEKNKKRIRRRYAYAFITYVCMVIFSILLIIFSKNIV